MMQSKSPFFHRLEFQWLLSFALWTLLAFISLGQAYYYTVNAGQVFPFYSRLVFELCNAYVWALLSPLIFFLARQYPIEKPAFFRHIGLHLLLALIVGMIHKAGSFYASLIIAPPANAITRDVIFFKITGGWINSVIIYWIMLGIYSALDYAGRFRQQKLLATQLEAQLTLAQLNALKMQLQPHFLFNTLHTIASLMEEDVKAAQRMIARLSELLRLTLEHVGEQEVPLFKEVEFLKCYLEIEEIRFHDRLRVQYSLPAEVMNAKVPTLILQPLVENAIRHGIAPNAPGGIIAISASQDNGSLRLEVRDNGRGASSVNQGVGLSNTKKRLEQLYGERYSFAWQNLSEGGFAVTVSLPYMTSDDQGHGKN